MFAPAPLLTVTIEQTPDERLSDEVHLHAGGQGLWIARLVAELGVDVVLCGSFGGETGRVARNLIREEGVEVRGIETSGSNGAYVHDRRSGERVETASMPADALTRHELDELYGIVLVEAFDATVTVLGGPAGRAGRPRRHVPAAGPRRALARRHRRRRPVRRAARSTRSRAASTCSRSARKSCAATDEVERTDVDALVAWMRSLVGGRRDATSS